MNKLFTTHSNILARFPHFGELADDMLDALDNKLMLKGFGKVLDVISCRPDIGTDGHPILSGQFKVDTGSVEVKCIHRKGEKKKHHYAVYIRRI